MLNTKSLDMPIVHGYKSTGSSRMTKVKRAKLELKSEPITNSTITFNCIFCSHQSENPNKLFDHMRNKHPDLCVIPQITATSDIIEEIEEPNRKPCPIVADFDSNGNYDDSSTEMDNLSSSLGHPNRSDNDEFIEEEYFEDMSDAEEIRSEEAGYEDDEEDIESPAMEPNSPSFNSSDLTISLVKPIKESSPSQYQLLNSQIEETAIYDDTEELDDEYLKMMEPICELEEEDKELHYSFLDNQENKHNGNGLKIQFPQGPGRGRRRDINETYLENQGDGFFQCTQCEKSFPYAGDLARHVRSHTLNKPYQCSICCKSFTHIGSLNTHLRIHSGERPYQCNKCEKAFTQSSSLMVHLRSHQTKKPYSCQACDKGFVNSSSLLLHVKQHSCNIALFACPECDKKFKLEQLLNEHMILHGDPNLYQCSICRAQFPIAADLVQHMKNHTGDKPFQCSICEKSFTQPGSLNTHMRIHTGERPFNCKECDKSFTQASSLSVHMKIHSPNKPFQCNLCSKSYSQQSYFNKHMRFHSDGHLSSICFLCSASFAKYSQLLNHLEISHFDKSEDSFACSLCVGRFKYPQMLLEHATQHQSSVLENQKLKKMNILMC